MIEKHNCKWEEISEASRLIQDSKLKLNDSCYSANIWPSGQGFDFLYNCQPDEIIIYTTGFNYCNIFRNEEKYENKIIAVSVTEYDTGMKFLHNLWFDNCIDDETMDNIFAEIDTNESIRFIETEDNWRIKLFMEKYKYIKENNE